MKPSLSILFFVSLSTASLGQELSNASSTNINFSPFTGVIYNMPILKIKQGRGTRISIKDYYDENVYDYDTLTQVSLKELNFPEASNDKARFPGLDQKSNFAMILKSVMTINRKGCYAFDLSSDDGSRLWINESELINNDGGHGMKTKVDTSLMTPGEYQTKVWYFQGMPDKYGLVFNATYLGEEAICQNKIKPQKEIIVLNDVLFDHDDAQLKPAGLQEIRKIANIIQSKIIKEITIIGHTDQRGSDAYNLKLSLRRAQAVKEALKELQSTESVNVNIVGRGSTQLIDEGASEESRAKNRRVEIHFGFAQ